MTHHLVCDGETIVANCLLPFKENDEKFDLMTLFVLQNLYRVALCSFNAMVNGD